MKLLLKIFVGENRWQNYDYETLEDLALTCWYARRLIAPILRKKLMTVSQSIFGTTSITTYISKDHKLILHGYDILIEECSNIKRVQTIFYWRGNSTWPTFSTRFK